MNSYVIMGDSGGKNLIVDTGFNRPECRDALFEGIEELKLDLSNTDVFLTHLHSDHTGNADALFDAGCHIFMGKIDYELIISKRNAAHPDSTEKTRFEKEGFPREQFLKSYTESPAQKFAPVRFTAQTVEDGQTLSYGGMELKCILTPGHTPGHICLYDAKSKTMILGDHVLFDITPNITAWEPMEDSLGSYMESLRKIKAFDVETPLPAHRSTKGMTMAERVDGILLHHRHRLEETLTAVRNQEGLTAYEIAGRISWKISCSSWEDFPIGQKMFAIGETFSHLDHLLKSGIIRREEDRNELVRYYCK